MIPANFSEAFSFVQASSYYLIFIIMIIEGPIITTAAAFAASLGYFNLAIIFFLSLFADLIGDFLHFFIGHVLRRTVIERYGNHLGLPKKRLKWIEGHLKNHLGKTLVVVKFTPPITTVGLLLAGALRVNFRRFLFYSFLITLPRTIFFTLAGFYFGVAVSSILYYFKWGQYSVIAILLVMIIAYFLYNKLYKKFVNKLALRVEKI